MVWSFAMSAKAHPSSSYANFRDPVGLAWRMLASGDRAAYDALARTALAAVISPLDRALALGERRTLEAAEEAELPPLLLIVGAPRSGTTLVYQVLAHVLDVTFFTNLSALFPRSPLTATRRLLGAQPSSKPAFQNFYGQTVGLAAPNDGFEMWNRWLGPDRYEAPKRLSPEGVRDMRRFLGAWTRTFGRPFLNKNNRNTACIEGLAAALPEARFIVVRRDPVYVAQSLVLAREVVQGSRARRWGLASRESTVADDPLACLDDVCDQVEDIERRLARQLATVPGDRYLEISFEDFCAKPAQVLLQIHRAFPEIPMHAERAQLKPFRDPSAEQLAPHEVERIRARLTPAAGRGPRS
jgi:hypothetical protein